MDYNGAIIMLPNSGVLSPRTSHATVWVVATMFKVWPTDNFDKSVHCVKMTGKSGVNWLEKHEHYYRLWNMRAEHVVGDDNFNLGVDYTIWYHQNGHLFTTPEVAAHMYQVV